MKVKALRKSLAVQKSLADIMRKKINKLTSDRHLKSAIRNGIKEFLLLRFTPAQTKVLMNPKKQTKARCSREDIIRNVALRSISPKGYEFLRKNGPLYLPSKQTMEKWLDGMLECRSGFNDDAIKLQRLKLESESELKPLYKHAIITFDEVHVKETVELYSKAQEIVGPHSKLQVVMIRGLTSD